MIKIESDQIDIRGSTVADQAAEDGDKRNIMHVRQANRSDARCRFRASQFMSSIFWGRVVAVTATPVFQHCHPRVWHRTGH